MSTIVVAPHEPEPAKLAKVIDQMTRLGPPEIRAWWDGEKWIALEGSHRLAAAEALGMTPEIEPMSLDEEMLHDFEDVSSRRVEDVIEYVAGTKRGPHYHFEHLGRW